MEIAVQIYLLFISGSLILLQTSRALTSRYMNWLFPFLVISSLVPVLFLLVSGKTTLLQSITEKALLFLFIPVSYVYILAQWRKRRPGEKALENWLSILARRITSLRQSGDSKTDTAQKQKSEAKQTVALFMSQDRAREIEMKIREHFTENKPYLQHGYSLRMLSSEIHIPLHHLSAFINKYHKMNFNDFINEYRILFCIDKLFKKEWKYKKLEAIAEDAGFNNRNTFTTAFKKATGLNPSEFLKYVKLGKFQKKTEQPPAQVNGEISKVSKLLIKLNEEMPDNKG